MQQEKDMGQEAIIRPRNRGGRSVSIWLLFLFLILCAAVIFLSFKTYRIRQESFIMTNLTESNYQKDFHDLAQHMDEITGQLAQVLSVTSREQLSLSLSTLWRQTFAAQSNLGGLPLAMVQLNQTEKFLGDTADTVYYLLWRTAREGDTLKDEEKEYVLELFKRSQTLSSALDEISYKIVKEDLRLVDLQNGLWQGEDMKDNTIIDGLGMLETKLEDYPELNITSDLHELAGSEENVPGPPNAFGKEFPSQGGDLKGANEAQQDTFDGEIISEETAIKNALAFWLGPEHVGFGGRIAYESGGDLPTYGVEIYTLKDSQSVANVDVVKKDGKVLWAMSVPDPDRLHGTKGAADQKVDPEQEDTANQMSQAVAGAVSEENLRVLQMIQGSGNISLEQGAGLCQGFLSDRDFPEMTLTHSQIEEGFGIYTFVPLQDGVLLYPDQIKMQVDLTTAQITGYEGSPFYRNHRRRHLPAVEVSREKVQTLLSPYLQVGDIRLALIQNDWNREILTWEVRASLGSEQFALYYDTEHAIEEKVIRLK